MKKQIMLSALSLLAICSHAQAMDAQRTLQQKLACTMLQFPKQLAMIVKPSSLTVYKYPEIIVKMNCDGKTVTGLPLIGSFDTKGEFKANYEADKNTSGTFLLGVGQTVVFTSLTKLMQTKTSKKKKS